jgi:hypothetical protein
MIEKGAAFGCVESVGRRQPTERALRVPEREHDVIHLPGLLDTGPLLRLLEFPFPSAQTSR